MDLSKGDGAMGGWLGVSGAAERGRRGGGAGQSGFPASLGATGAPPQPFQLSPWSWAPHKSTGGSLIPPDCPHPALSLLPGRC